MEAAYAEPARTISKTGDALSQAEDALGQLGELIGMVEKRLDPILEPPSPEKDGPGRMLTDASPRSQVTERIESIARAIENQRNHLGQILSRVEV